MHTVTATINKNSCMLQFQICMESILAPLLTNFKLFLQHSKDFFHNLTQKKQQKSAKSRPGSCLNEPFLKKPMISVADRQTELIL